MIGLIGRQLFTLVKAQPYPGRPVIRPIDLCELVPEDRVSLKRRRFPALALGRFCRHLLPSSTVKASISQATSFFTLISTTVFAAAFGLLTCIDALPFG